ncbi:MAG: IS110 family transposase [Acidobacteria bacterium]|nr:IS110 family transposase [Acidobacteriota bacterium]
MLDFIDEMIADFQTQILAQGQPFRETVTAWREIPGVSDVTAWTLVAEIGDNMDQFGSAAHLASWACICPGTEESAGKRLSGKTRKGSVWLRRGLVEAAWGASRKRILISRLSSVALPYGGDERGRWWQWPTASW